VKIEEVFLPSKCSKRSDHLHSQSWTVVRESYVISVLKQDGALAGLPLWPHPHDQEGLDNGTYMTNNAISSSTTPLVCPAT
jgi:hypothetical protein